MKRRFTTTRLHAAISQKTDIFKLSLHSSACALCVFPNGTSLTGLEQGSQNFSWCSTVRNLTQSKYHQYTEGPTFVGTGSVTPEVPELPSAWGYNWATWPQGDTDSGEWPSRLGVGRKASDLTLEKLIATKSQTRTAGWSDLSEKAKTHNKGL
jgi:hypothetical protein